MNSRPRFPTLDESRVRLAVARNAKIGHLSLMPIDVVEADCPFFWGAGSGASAPWGRAVQLLGGPLLTLDGDSMPDDRCGLVLLQGRVPPAQLHRWRRVSRVFAALPATEEAGLTVWELDVGFERGRTSALYTLAGAGVAEFAGRGSKRRWWRA